MKPQSLSVIISTDSLGQRVLTINNALFVVSEWSDRASLHNQQNLFYATSVETSCNATGIRGIVSAWKTHQV